MGLNWTYCVFVLAFGLIIFSCAEEKKLDKKAFAEAFHEKSWYSSTDNGNTWSRVEEAGKVKFNPEGDPIHANPVWIQGQWKDENTVAWVASEGTRAIWKSFDPRLTDDDREKWRAFAASFPLKKWYYSLDNGAHWSAISTQELKEFNNGAPIHVSDAWMPGQWVDENTIAWRAINNTESLWKAFDIPPPIE